MEEELTFTAWVALLAVVWKGTFFNCAYFLVLFTLKQLYGNTNDFLAEANFTAMKRGLPCSQTPGGDQRILNGEYDVEDGGDRTRDLEPCECLATKFKLSFVPRSATSIIDDDHLETKEDPGPWKLKKSQEKSQWPFGRRNVPGGYKSHHRRHR